MGQKIIIPDSLKEDSLEKLYEKFQTQSVDSLTYSIYGHACIAKHRTQTPSYEEWGYYYMANLDPRNNYMHYYDSVIKYAQKSKNYEMVSIAYHNIGKNYNTKRNFKKALDNYIKAYRIANDNDIKRLVSTVQISIGLMHERTGNYKKSLHSIRSSYDFIRLNYKDGIIDTTDKEQFHNYLNNLNLLANSYRLNKSYDSAVWAVNKVYDISIEKKTNRFLNKARFNMAEIHFDKMEYEATLDSINIALDILKSDNDTKNIAYAYYLRGMSYINLDKILKGITELEKMDSIFSTTNDLHPVLRPGFEKLIEFNKSERKIEDQLYYVEQLLKFDSIINDNRYYLATGIVNYIDKPALIEKQNELREKLDLTTKKVVFIYI